MTSISAEFTAQLRTMALIQLSRDWQSINYTHFRSALRQPAISIGQSTAFLGRWTPDPRGIEISEAAILGRSWACVCEILKHEIAHQAVQELYCVEEAPHGPMFRKVCEHLGIPAAASDRGGDLEATTSHDELDATQAKLMDRVKKLLALAESPNRNEAEVAAASAQRLIYKYNLEIQDERIERGFCVLHLGEPSGRIQEHERRLAVILASHFFVETLWIHSYRPLDGKTGSVMEVTGRPANVAMAEYVYHFLLDTGHRLWEQHKKETGSNSNRPRLSFLAGIMQGFDVRLSKQEESMREEGLVLVANAQLQDFFRKRNPYTRSVSSSGQPRNDAYVAGSKAGQSIVLQKPVSSSSSNAAPKALPRGR